MRAQIGEMKLTVVVVVVVVKGEHRVNMVNVYSAILKVSRRAKRCAARRRGKS